MGTNSVRSVILAIAVAVTTSGCVMQQATELLGPSGSNPSGDLPLPGNSGPSLAGLWESTLDVGSPESWSCSSLQWNITGQTAMSLEGTFSAICNGVIGVSGNASGDLNGDEVTLEVEGTASLEGEGVSCPFTLTGEGEIQDKDTMEVAYEGTTCFGPVNGNVRLRRPAPPAAPEEEEEEAPAPPPPPPPPPPASVNRHHVGPGPLNYDRAKMVVLATGAEFPHLLRSFPTAEAAQTAAEELLLRTIWHLELIGFNAARQRNPSGAISKDKLTIFIDGKWHAYDFIRAYGEANQPSSVMLFEVWPADPKEQPGIPD